MFIDDHGLSPETTPKGELNNTTGSSNAIDWQSIRDNVGVAGKVIGTAIREYGDSLLPDQEEKTVNSESIARINAIRSYIKEHPDENLDFGTNLDDILMGSHDYRYKKVKGLMHDTAYETSGEGAAMGLSHAREYELAEPEELAPEDAHLFARELGIEKKFDKPITKGQVRYQVEKEILKRAREAELQKYMATGDYSAIENIMFGLSAISGALPASDLGVMAGTSALLGTGVATSLANLAKAAKTTKDLTQVAKIMQTAGRTIALANKAEKYAAVAADMSASAKKVNDINKAVTTAKRMMNAERAGNVARVEELTKDVSKLSPTQKLAYDAFRMGKGATGVHGSAASVGALFAADAVVSDVPRVTLKLTESDVASDNSYTMKDAMAEELLGAAGAFALPVGWTGAKQLRSIYKEVQEDAARNIASKTSTEVANSICKGHRKEAQEAAEIGGEAQKVLSSISDNGEIGVAAREILNAADYIGNSNMSEAGVVGLVGLLQRCIRGELRLNQVLDNFVERNTFLSSVKGLANSVKESVANKTNALDFFAGMEKAGVKFAAKNMGEAEYYSAIKRFLTTGEGCSVQVLGRGALEQKAFSGVSPNFVKVFMHETYKSLFADGDDAVEGYMRANMMHEQLKELSRRIEEIRYINDEINKANSQAGKIEGVSGINYRTQRTMYPLGNGQYGSLRNAMNNLADMFLPSTDKRLLSMDNQALSVLTGKQSQQYRQALQNQKEFRKWFWEQFGTLDKKDKYLYENLKANVLPNTTEYSRTGAFHNLAKTMEDMVKNNEELLNSGELFQYKYGDNMEDLINKLIAEDVPELAYSNPTASKTRLEVMNFVRDDNKLKELVDFTEDSFNMRKTETITMKGSNSSVKVNIYALVTKLSDNIKDAISRGGQTGHGVHDSAINMWADNEKLLNKIETLLNGDYVAIQDQFIEKIQGLPLFENMVKAGPESMANMLKGGKLGFKTALKETFLTPIVEATESKVIPRSLDEAINAAFDKMVEHVGAMKEDKAGNVFDLFKKREVDTTKGVEQVDFEAQYLDKQNQRKAFTDILEPFLQDVTRAVARLKIETETNQMKIMDKVVPALQRPGRMGEMLLSMWSFTNVNAKGVGLSVEALSNPAKHIENFWARIRQSGGDELEKYVKAASKTENPKEFEQIQRDVITIKHKLEGTLTKEEELAFDANSMSARVAQALIDEAGDIAGKIYQEGGALEDLVPTVSRAKMRSHQFLHKIGKETLGRAGEQGIERNKNIIKGNLDRVLTLDDYNETKKRLYLYAFEDADLDKTLNANGYSKISYNELRDTIMEGDLRNLTTRYSETEIEEACKRMSDGIVDRIIDPLIRDSNGFREEDKLFRGKFLEDAKPPMYFKNKEAELEAMKWYGFDSMEQWMETTITAGKRMHGIIAGVGTEPYQLAKTVRNLLKNLSGSEARKIVDDSGRRIFSDKDLDQIAKKFNDEAEKQFNYLMNDALGGFSTPSTGTRKWVGLIQNLVGTPMIAASPIKGLTDFSNILQHMVSLGLSTGGNWPRRVELFMNMLATLPGLGKAESNTMLKDLCLQTSISQNMLYDLIASSGEANFRGAEGRELLEIMRKVKMGELTPDAPAYMKLEPIIQGATDAMNKVLRITAQAEKNRTYAGFHIMRGIADNCHIPYEKLNAAMQQSLSNYGINKAEWNFLRIKAREAVDTRINKINGTKGTHYGNDYFIFNPAAIQDISDEEIASFMKESGYRVINDMAIKSTRSKLYDKACGMVNAGADEMMNIPNARIRGQLLNYNDPNSVAGVSYKFATQFQSFGAMTVASQFGRRWHSFVSADDPLLSNFALWASGMNSSLKAAGSLGGMVIETMIWNGLLYEMIKAANGKSQSVYTPSGEFQSDVAADKCLRYLVDSIGLYGNAVDTITNVFTGGAQGVGGGFAIPVAPVASNVLSGASKVTKAMAREENEGHRLQAGAAQLADNFGSTAAKAPFLQAAYNTMIGNKLKEYSMGPKAYRDLQRRHYREGYQQSWSDALAENLFTNQ